MSTQELSGRSYFETQAHVQDIDRDTSPACSTRARIFLRYSISIRGVSCKPTQTCSCAMCSLKDFASVKSVGHNLQQNFCRHSPASSGKDRSERLAKAKRQGAACWPTNQDTPSLLLLETNAYRNPAKDETPPCPCPLLSVQGSKTSEHVQL